MPTISIKQLNYFLEVKGRGLEGYKEKELNFELHTLLDLLAHQKMFNFLGLKTPEIFFVKT
ncbi:MAG: hypothetical protein JXA43_00415, partial [Candidatus Diapherotrites archaeon]|nr:hypothetical protein [Candidatus Diapherotrites archaeon]